MKNKAKAILLNKTCEYCKFYNLQSGFCEFYTMGLGKYKSKDDSCKRWKK